MFIHYGCHTELHNKICCYTFKFRYKKLFWTFSSVFFLSQGQITEAELLLQKSIGLNLSVAMFPKWPGDPWMCLQTFVTAVSLSPQSHKALSVPGWSREPRPKNRLSDKELKAAGGLGLKRGTERFFFPPTRLSPSLASSLVSTAGKMTSVSQSQKRFSVR